MSNPPYIAKMSLMVFLTTFGSTSRESAVGGVTGCEIVQRLVAQASGCLSSNGWMFLEVGPSTASTAEKIVSDAPELVGEPTVKDGAGLPRVIQARAL